MRGYLAFIFRCNVVSHPGLQGLNIHTICMEVGWKYGRIWDILVILTINQKHHFINTKPTIFIQPEN